MNIINLPEGPEEPLDIGFTDNALELISSFKKQYGKCFSIFSPFRKAHTYVISDPEMVKHVMLTNNKNYTKGVGMDRVKMLLGNGIIVSEGDFWRKQRRMIQPSFHRKVIERLSESMHEVNQRAHERWTRIAKEGGTINITKEMSDISLEIVLNAIFSVDLENLIKEKGENPFMLITENTTRDLQFAVKFRSLTGYVKEFRKKREREERIEFDFLSMLMETRDKDTEEKMTEKELLDEVMSLIVAGHETSAATLSWSWYLLSVNSGKRDLLHSEVDALNGRIPTFEDLKTLNYTEQILKETMRLYPPVWLITRRAINEDQIGAYSVAPKTDIFISPYFIQRDESYWENPEEFHPERFSTENIKERHRFTYFPFSGGPRQCVGDFFAMVEMQIHLGYLSQTFQMEYVDEGEIELEPQINLRSKRDLTLRPVIR
ncbi:MAG: cytochrome P450 [Bacteroidota bacterium]